MTPILKGVLGLLVFVLPACTLRPAPSYSVIPRTYEERYFDIDKSGWLSAYEQGLLRTHRVFGWELANSRQRKKFDSNGDHMLDPFEWKKYEEGRKKEKVRYHPVPFKK